MGKGHRQDVLVHVEEAVGERCDVGVHASLAVQRADELGAAGGALDAQQAFEERGGAAVGELDGMEQGLVGAAVVFALLHHGG